METARTSRTQTTGQAAPAATSRTAASRTTVPVTPSAAATVQTPAVRLSTEPGAPASAPVPAQVAQLVNAPGQGQPLLRDVKEALENSLEVPLDPVRVHTEPRSAAVVDSLGARAFTYGLHVFLGSRERPDDLGLMAHEVAHVVQQQGRPVLQMSAEGATADAFEKEAEQTSLAVSRGERANVKGRTGGPRVQGIWPVDQIVDWLEDRAWSLIRRYAPMLEPILRHGPSGVIEWLKEKVVSAIESIIDTLMAPVRLVTGAAEWLSSHFANLIAWMREAAAKIAQGDCRPINEAAAKIQQVVEGIVTPIVEKIQSAATRIKNFFTGLWDRFGAPVWDFLRRIGGAAWEKIQELASWIWDKTEPIRRILARAWRWIKNKLGIGEGPEGQNGILQWIQRKASDAWDWIMARIAPFKRQLLTVAAVLGGVLLMLSPAGPVIAAGAAIFGLVRAVRFFRQIFGTPNGVVDQRNALRSTVIPAVMGAIRSVTDKITSMANAVSGKLGEVVGGMGQMVSAVAGSILRFAVSVVEWVADKLRAFANWANEKLTALANWISNGLNRLLNFLQPVFDVLGQIAEVFMNLMRIPFLVAGRLWNLIPACIRNPFINFLINQILKRIPIVREIVEIVEIWPQIQAEIMGILRQIFRDRDLMGALKRIFQLLLRALRVPVDLVVTILRKAATAWDAVLEHPIDFLKNILRAMKQAFSQFFRGILGHLWYGITGWIFNQLGEVGIQAPSSWTDLRAVFGLVLQILGLTLDHIFELLARRLSPERVAQIRRAVNFLTGAWEWVSVAIREGPAGIWRMLLDRLRDLGNLVLDAAINWIIENVTNRVSQWLLSLLDPTGIMAVVNSLIAFYRAVQSAIEYLRQILEMVNRVLDSVINIARGVIGPAATAMEDAMHRAMPVIVGFLANQLGLRGLGRRMREIIGAIRERVDTAILWLIDQAIRLGQAVLNALGMGAGQPQAPGRPPGALGQVLTFEADGETHRLWIERRGQRNVVMVASDGGKPVEELVSEGRTIAQRLSGEPQAKMQAAVTQVEQSNEATSRAAEAAAQTPVTGGPTPPAGGQPQTATAGTAVTTAEEVEKTKTIAYFNTLRETRFELFRNDPTQNAKPVANRRFAPLHSLSTPYSQASKQPWMLQDYMAYIGQRLPPVKSERTYRYDLEAAIGARRASSVNQADASYKVCVEAPPEITPVVKDTGGDSLNEKLKLIVESLGASSSGIVAFMRQMRRGSASGGGQTMSRSEFDDLWGIAVNRNWLKNRLRGGGRYHEWIPTSLIQDVIERASTTADAVEAARWVELQDELRTETRWLIFKPDRYSTPELIAGRSYIILNGHNGNLYIDRDGELEPATKNEGYFHGACAQAFTNNPQSTLAAINALEAVFRAWIWDGSMTLPGELHPDLVDAYGRYVALRPSLLAAQQRSYYASIERFFSFMKGRYS